MKDLDLAIALADAADHLTLDAFYNRDFTVETKPDMTPVTTVDRAVEEKLRELLSLHAPDDAIVGEEFEPTTGSGTRQWIIDPIDGTKNYVRGVPVYATLISLYDGETPLLGVVSAPAMNRRWWASKSEGAWTTMAHDPAPVQIHVSQVSKLEDASFSYASLGGWKDLGKREALLELCDTVWRTRAYGDFWSYMLVAEGAVDIAAEPELEVYDMGALVPIVTEAGGTFTSLNGTNGPFDGNALASNGLVHSSALELLS